MARIVSGRIDFPRWHSVSQLGHSEISASSAARRELGILWDTLTCGCEEEYIRETGMLYLHYLPTCWRHAPSPPFVIEEEP